MISACELKNLINKYTNSKEPFLFGVDFEMDRGFILTKPLEQQEVLWRTSRYSNFERATPAQKTFTPKFIDFEEYRRKFNIAQQALLNGDTFLINLTVKTEITTDYSLKEIALGSSSTYLLYLPDTFVCFSPETFVKIDKQGVISTNPMKGTISSLVENAEQTILNDYKESAEHFTIVDLLRSDISRVATKTTVSRMRYIDKLSTSKGDILQVSSQINGTLLDGYKNNIGNTLFELLPAGSVSGAPKKSTLHTIQQAEKEKRGFYCGVFGYFDGEELDTAVLIRFIEQQGNQYFFRSGAGITINSDPQNEYEENNHKIYLPFR